MFNSYLMKPLITILITTRERATRLDKCLATCLGQDWSDCELLISDNVSKDHTKQIIDNYNGLLPINYINPGKRLGMSEHWEFAIPYAKGKYLCVIGDDDGVPSWGIMKMKLLLFEFPEVDAICWYQTSFYYPDLPDPIFAGLFDHHGGDIVHLRSALTTLTLFMGGSHGYSELPGVYHKLSRTSLVKDIVTKGIIGVAPDISIASVLTTKIENYIYTRTPLTIPGTSPSSNGFATLSQVGDKARASIFLNETSVSIGTPFNNLSFKFESNWHLMQLETIHKLLERQTLPQDFPIDYVEHLRQVRWEAKTHSNVDTTQLDEDLWKIYQEVTVGSSHVVLDRINLLIQVSKQPKYLTNLGKGNSPYLRLSMNTPDIFSAMPYLEDAIHTAEETGHQIIRRVIPTLSRLVESGSYSKALKLLPHVISVFGGDLVYLTFSPSDLKKYLGKFFNESLVNNYCYSITLVYYIIYSKFECISLLEKLLCFSLKDQNSNRFNHDLKLIDKIVWNNYSDVLVPSGKVMHYLKASGLIWTAPFLKRLKSGCLRFIQRVKLC